MKRAFTIMGMLLILASLVPAAEITGAWKGAFDLNGDSVPVTFNLKGSGDTVTGTIDGLPTPSAAIQDGKLQGDIVTFWISVDYQGQAYKIVYKGKVSGDEIQFTFGTEDGGWGAELTAKRSS